MEEFKNRRFWISRRQWFHQIGNLMIFSFLATGLASCTTQPVAKYKEWLKKIRNPQNGGEAVINRISGKAYLNGDELKVKDKIPSGESVILSKDSQLFIKLPDDSVIKFKGEAKFNLNLGLQQGGTFKLEYGSLLAVIKKKRRRKYLFRGANAVVGIRGTVFFGKVVKKGVKMPDQFPENVSEYFCLCNGKADYISTMSNDIVMTDVSYHHSSYFITLDGKGTNYTPAGVLVGHSDREIDELIDTMEGEKHDKQWLSV